MSTAGSKPDSVHLGFAGRIARAFIDSKLTPLFVVTSILLGAAATWLLPREEEPQIKVPMIDVLVSMPGFSAKEVEERATRPMEKLLWEIPGVEYIYSTSREGECLAIVRFQVGEDIVRSLVYLNQKLQANFDRIPFGVSYPLIKPRSIDDVPILALTLHGPGYDHYTLRRILAEVDDAVKQVPLVAETTLIGGDRRQLRVLLDPARLASRQLSAAEILPRLQAANRQQLAGSLTGDNREVVLQAGSFLASAKDAGNVVVGVHGSKPVYLREVAEIVDGPEEPSQYVFFGAGAAPGEGNAASEHPKAGTFAEEPAVTLTIAKRPGANAISVAHDVLRKVDALKGRVIPNDVQVAITRHYGQTAEEKSNELLLHMGIAVIGVSLLILLTLGWRESIVVGIAIPCTLALTLLVFYLHGYTLNRITLFALIFSIGILVDDAIVVVENIVRHFHLPRNQGRPWPAIAVEAVNEVGNPTILATFAVISAVLPMAFVGGLMGPYMRPIPTGASAAMFWSLAIAFIVTPWAAIRILRWGRKYSRPAAASPAVGEGGQPHSHFEHEEDFFTRLYRRFMGPLIAKARWRLAFLAGIVALLLAAMATVGLGWVKVKMLPFDNKSEFQIILNMPEGSALELTAQAAREIGAAVRVEPEVTDYQVYAGVAAPFNFNGLVRHYFMRRGPHIADLQINLVPKSQRKAQSHDIAKHVRPRVAAIAAKYDARVAVAEVPPGPPVLQTLVAEIYGPSEASRLALARQVINIFTNTPGVVDTDWYIESDQAKARFVVDKEKAALHGITEEAIAQTLKLAVGGTAVDLLHLPREKEDLLIIARLPQSLRTSPEDLLALRVRGANTAGPLVPLRELVKVESSLVDKSRYHKNLKAVTYVIGDVAGEIESPVYAIQQMNKALAALDTRQYGGSGAPLKVYNASQPFTDNEPAIKWDGEWHITIEVFRDLGSAFAAVLVLIFILMVGWFRSFLTPLVVMAAIPFSLVGILPAHGLMGAFFTATSMIGFMAGAGIVVRNSIILVDFIELRLAEGMPLDQAVVDSGAVRFRPMLLTALAVVVGASVILADPIFQGLAIALMAGEIASLLISRTAVPVLYFMASRRKL
ncbi:MAG TPA: efflux RND transporter permease subunit [Candidatus Paceibacterota bacterium]|nr:efflux RND transporter permease subunit [Verrucomicrobiota bacterium]HSA09188.1 efflux RND transporter permease subunit [Candidatus Paceibacterota bacterium]